MADRDVAGAEAAARFILDVYSYTLSSQDTTAWKALAYEGCVFCQGILDDVARDASSGRTVHSGEFTILGTETTKINPSVYGVVMELAQEPSQVWNLDGTPASEPDAGWHGWLHLVMYQEGSSWFLREGETLDEEPTS